MTPRQQMYVDLARAGFSQRDIAGLCGVTRSAVSRTMQRAGTPPAPTRTPSNRVQPDDAVLGAWRELLVMGETTREKMAEHFGVNVSTVWRWIPGTGEKTGRKPAQEASTRPGPEPERELRSQQRREAEAAKRAALLAELEAIR